MKLDWDDLQIFLEVQRTGRLSHAGRRLGQSHTTVARRIKRLEQVLGMPLFDVSATGLELTETGKSILPFAENMERAAFSISEQVDTTRGQGKRRVRVGAPDGFGNAILSQILPKLMVTEPCLEVELVPIPVTHKLWRRDVDIAISLDRPQTGRLVMRKLTDYDLRLYAGPDFFATHKRPRSADDLQNLPFVGYVNELLYTRELDFNAIIRPGLNIVYRGATVKAQFDAVSGNVGLGVLPCFMADHTDLEPILSDEVTFSRTYWMLYPEEYRDLDRIKMVSAFIFDETRAMADQFRFSPGP